jgi:hypothetical protein
MVDKRPAALKAVIYTVAVCAAIFLGFPELCIGITVGEIVVIFLEYEQDE